MIRSVIETVANKSTLPILRVLLFSTNDLVRVLNDWIGYDGCYGRGTCAFLILQGGFDVELIKLHKYSIHRPSSGLHFGPSGDV